MSHSGISENTRKRGERERQRKFSHSYNLTLPWRSDRQWDKRDRVINLVYSDACSAILIVKCKLEVHHSCMAILIKRGRLFHLFCDQGTKNNPGPKASSLSEFRGARLSIQSPGIDMSFSSFLSPNISSKFSMLRVQSILLT